MPKRFRFLNGKNHWNIIKMIANKKNLVSLLTRLSIRPLLLFLLLFRCSIAKYEFL